YHFYSIPRPAPKSTLLPYTTLFRSQIASKFLVEILAEFAVTNNRVAARRDDLAEARRAVKLVRRIHQTFDGIEPQVAMIVSGWVDRKSTRLNSSHVSISYAVFCLKK